MSYYEYTLKAQVITKSLPGCTVPCLLVNLSGKINFQFIELELYTTEQIISTFMTSQNPMRGTLILIQKHIVHVGIHYKD